MNVPLSIFFLSLCLLLVGCTISGNITGAATANLEEEISVRLPIPFYDASFTPLFVAQDQGYYEKEGLEVKFNLGNSETNPAKMVTAGVDEFGILGGPDTLLVARSRGLELVGVSVLHRNSDFSGIITLKESGLTTINDLEGKKIGFFYGHISTDVIHSLLAKEDIGYTEIDVGSDYNQLITGKIDAQWVFRTTGIINLENKGYEVNFISPEDYGINTHGYTIFVSQDFLDNNPDTIERFLRATFKGIEYAIENPDSATSSLLKRDSKLDYDLELSRWTKFSEPIVRDSEFPIGYLDHQMFEETYVRLSDLDVLENEFDVSVSYTTKFIDKIYSR